jgi:hypothetical protein
VRIGLDNGYLEGDEAVVVFKARGVDLMGAGWRRSTCDLADWTTVCDGGGMVLRKGSTS